MIPLTGQDVENCLGNDQPIAAEGYYQIKLAGYRPSEYNGVAKHQMKWQIVGAPRDLLSERGKYLSTFWSEDSQVFVKQICKAGVACGMFSEHQVREWFKSGAMPDPDFETWLGALCVCKVTHSEYKNKTYANIGFDFYPLEHACVEEAEIIFDKDNAGQNTAAGDDTPF